MILKVYLQKVLLYARLFYFYSAIQSDKSYCILSPFMLYYNHRYFISRDIMQRDNNDKKYQSYKIPPRHEFQSDGAGDLSSEPKHISKNILSDDIFHEIEYTPFPAADTGAPMPKPQKIAPPEKDEKRELFNEMRDIARQYRSPLGYYSGYFDRRSHQDNARIFYEQAMFMKDFEDDCQEQAPFSAYFPYYQMLGYNQLRTYFTWRTKVRKGVIENISLSYAYLYIYELLNNIGVTSPLDGIDKLLSFRISFRNFEPSIDKYVLKWIKDYHIYYGLPQSFRDFVKEHDLVGCYPELTSDTSAFDLFCSVSKYDIRKSKFFTAETSELITDCFSFVMDRIRHDFETAGMSFDNLFFYPRKASNWIPFKNALFCQHLTQPDRRVVISEKEIYICNNNQWTYSTSVTTENGKRFIGYVIKQMEAVLRQLTKYRFKLTASTDMVHPETIAKLQSSGIFIDKTVQSAVNEFYKEATKIIVTVDRSSLARIRQEALETQESLTVEEQPEPLASYSAPTPQPDEAPVGDAPDIWDSFRSALTETELQALTLILHGENLKAFADAHNIMLEVLADGINEKAMDHIGDNLLDDGLAIYEDYENQVKGMIK